MNNNDIFMHLSRGLRKVCTVTALVLFNLVRQEHTRDLYHGLSDSVALACPANSERALRCRCRLNDIGLAECDCSHHSSSWSFKCSALIMSSLSRTSQEQRVTEPNQSPTHHM